MKGSTAACQGIEYASSEKPAACEQDRIAAENRIKELKACCEKEKAKAANRQKK